MKVSKYKNATRVKLQNRYITVYEPIISDGEPSFEGLLLEFVVLDKKNMSRDRVVNRHISSCKRKGGSNHNHQYIKGGGNRINENT